MTGTRASLRRMPVGDVMTRAVKTIEDSASLQDCVGLMRDNDIGCVVVVKNGEPIGMFTERDVLRRLVERSGNLQLAVKDAMSRPLKTIAPTATIWDAIEEMNKSRIRHLPVVDAGRLVGILSMRDLFRLFFSHQDLLLEALHLEETRRFMSG